MWSSDSTVQEDNQEVCPRTVVTDRPQHTLSVHTHKRVPAPLGEQTLEWPALSDKLMT